MSDWMLIDHGLDELEDLRHVQIHVFSVMGPDVPLEDLQGAMVALLGTRQASEKLREARLTLVPLQDSRALGTWWGEIKYSPVPEAQ